MKRILLLILVMLLAVQVFADEYIIISGDKSQEKMARKISEVLNKRLKDNNNVIQNWDFEDIVFQKLDYGKTEIKYSERKCSIEKSKIFKNGYLSDCVKIFGVDGGKEFSEFGYEEDGYYDFKLPFYDKGYGGNEIMNRMHYDSLNGGSSQEIQFPFEINLLEYKNLLEDKVYKFIDLNAKYGKNEFKMIYRMSHPEKPIVAYMKITDINYAKGFEKVYSEAMKEYHSSRDMKKTVEILENGGFNRIIRRNPKDVSRGKYFNMLNDYAFFLSEIGRELEAIPILRDIIELNPERMVAYLNLGDVYKKAFEGNGNKEVEQLMKHCYQKYYDLMVTQGKEGKIPERVKNEMKEYDKNNKLEMVNRYKLDYIEYEKYTLENGLKLMRGEEYYIYKNLTKLSEKEAWELFDDFKNGKFEEVKPLYECYYADDLKFQEYLGNPKKYKFSYEIPYNNWYAEAIHYFRIYNVKNIEGNIIFAGQYIDKNGYYYPNFSIYYIEDTAIKVEPEIDYFTGKPLWKYSSGRTYITRTGMFIKNNKSYIYQINIANLENYLTNGLTIYVRSEENKNFYKIIIGRRRKK